MEILFSNSEIPEELMLLYTIYFGFFAIIMLAFSIISYIFQGKGMYAIAKRRGIEKPWLAWVPVGNMWLLGCISDQFRYLAYGQNTKRRRILLTLNIVVLAAALLLLGGLIGVALGTGANESAGPLAVILIVGIYAILGVSIAATVLQYKCYFDLFRSCVPSRSVLYLILSILVTYPLPFFIYSCRNKDLGMPPRSKPEAQYPPELPIYENDY